MKVAFYGNNLDHGYLFVRALAERGIESCLFAPRYLDAQEEHGWWSDTAQRPELVHRFELVLPGIEGRLVDSPVLADVYRRVLSFDLLVMMEAGPALFSELDGVRKVFFSAGADLQILPFVTEVEHEPGKGGRLLRALGAKAARLDVGGSVDALAAYRAYRYRIRENVRIQTRQRRGLAQCERLILAPYQDSLVARLELPLERARYLPFPMHEWVLGQVDSQRAAELAERHRSADVVFLHPTRQFFLPLNNDRFLKDNDKLLLGYRDFVRDSARSSKLVLIRKGRAPDLEAAARMVGELGLDRNVEWVDEIPNKDLRAYFSLPNVVVCDQFSPNLASLGNLGREASYFGAPLITAFAPWNRKCFGEDLPPHVFPACTAEEVTAGMRAVAALSAAVRTDLSREARAWFDRQLAARAVMPRFIELFGDLLAGSSRS